jgi:hypothetical protein
MKPLARRLAALEARTVPPRANVEALRARLAARLTAIAERLAEGPPRPVESLSVVERMAIAATPEEVVRILRAYLSGRGVG